MQEGTDNQESTHIRRKQASRQAKKMGSEKVGSEQVESKQVDKQASKKQIKQKLMAIVDLQLFSPPSLDKYSKGWTASWQ